MLGGYQICSLAAIRKAPQIITDGRQPPGLAAPDLLPNADYERLLAGPARASS